MADNGVSEQGLTWEQSPHKGDSASIPNHHGSDATFIPFRFTMLFMFKKNQSVLLPPVSDRPQQKKDKTHEKVWQTESHYSCYQQRAYLSLLLSPSKTKLNIHQWLKQKRWAMHLWWASSTVTSILFDLRAISWGRSYFQPPEPPLSTQLLP